jgi:hypothetical protein
LNGLMMASIFFIACPFGLGDARAVRCLGG